MPPPVDDELLFRSLRAGEDFLFVVDLTMTVRHALTFLPKKWVYMLGRECDFGHI